MNLLAYQWGTTNIVAFFIATYGNLLTIYLLPKSWFWGLNLHDIYPILLHVDGKSSTNIIKYLQMGSNGKKTMAVMN